MLGNSKGRIRRITIVAVARELLIALWRYLERGLVPKGPYSEGVIRIAERRSTDLTGSKVGW
jgi:hypothetical protein